ncbi:MAG: ribose 5-phosphate isomerase B [Desulfovibrionales bacterium]
MNKKRIAVGSDHAGFTYKEAVKKHLLSKGWEVADFGTLTEDPVDYPLFIRPVAEAVAAKDFHLGIVLGGSGNGEAMVANKVPGIRCAVCWNKQTARWAREHNDANMISMGQRTITKEEALSIVDTWLDSTFLGGRHLRRVKEIEIPVSPVSSG